MKFFKIILGSLIIAAFAIDIANVFGKNFVLAVINASNKRYAKNKT